MARDGTIEDIQSISGTIEKAQDITGSITNNNNVSGSLTVPAERIVPGNYPDLRNKPMIEGVTLIGDKSFRQLGLNEITEEDIDEIIYGG